MIQKQMNSRFYILVVIGIVSAFGPFVTDFYLPALPALSSYFDTTAPMVQLSLTFSMIGLAAGQLFIGPLSDKYGRKIPLQASLLLFVISTFACFEAGTIGQFLFFRFIQGVAGAGGVVISKSVAVDLYKGKELATFFSMLSSVQGLAPICAPVLGGLLLEVTDWRGIFQVLFVIGILLFVAIACFHESLPETNRIKGNLAATFKCYLPVIKNHRFIYFVLVQAFAMGVMFTYIAASPFIFQQHYGVSPIVYGLCFGVNAVGIMIGSFVVTRFKDTRRGLLAGVKGFLMISFVVALVLLANLPFIYVEVVLFFFLIFLGMILPTSTTLALELERENSGNASAVLGFVTFFFGGVFSPLAGLGNMIYSTSAIIIVCCICTLVCVRLALRE